MATGISNASGSVTAELTADASKRLIKGQESFSNHISAAMSRAWREGGRQGIQTDNDTRKVISTTKTVMIPVAAEAAAIAAATAYKVYESSIEKNAKNIDPGQLMQEAQNKGTAYDTVEAVTINGTRCGDATIEKAGAISTDGFNGITTLKTSVDNYQDVYQGIESAIKKTKIKGPDGKKGTAETEYLFDKERFLNTHVNDLRAPIQEKLEGLNVNVEIVKKTIDKDTKEVISSVTTNKSATIKELTELNLSSESSKAIKDKIKTQEIVTVNFDDKSIDMLKNSIKTSVASQESVTFRRGWIESTTFSPQAKENAIQEITSAIASGRDLNMNNVISFQMNSYGLANEARISHEQLGTIIQQQIKDGCSAKTRTGRLLQMTGANLKMGIGFTPKGIDKALYWQDKMTRQADKMQRYYHKLHSPKHLLRSGFRILTKPLEQSDAMKGMGYARSIGMGTFRFARLVKNPALNLAQNSFVFVIRQRQLKQLAIKEGKTVREIKKLKDLNELLKANHIKLAKYVNFRDSLNQNPLLAGLRKNLVDSIRSFRSDRIFNSASQKYFKFVERHGRGGEYAKYLADKLSNAKLLQNGTFTRRQFSNMNRFEKHILKLKRRERFASSKVGQLGRSVATKVGKVTNKLTSPFRFVKRKIDAIKRKLANTILGKFFTKIFAKVSEVFGKIMITVMKYLFIAIIAILTFFLLLQITYYALLFVDSMTTWTDRFTLCGTSDYEKKAKKFMKALEDCHEEQLNELKDLQATYEVADIEYPSGENENYKELWCAMAVQSQYDPTMFTTKEVKDMASSLYEQTHKMTYSEYTYCEADGTEKTACHIYLYLLRGEGLAYKELSETFFISDDYAGEYNGAEYAVATDVVNDDWLNVVQALKRAIASTGCVYSEPSNPYRIKMTVNDRTFSVRPDCSGYVSFCLQVYGSLNETYSSYLFTATDSIPGFTKLAWSGWDNLNPGDIISTRGHVEIFAYNLSGYHYVYNCGSTPSVQSSVPTVSSHSSYITVWRPQDPGTTDFIGDTNDDAGENVSNDTSKSINKNAWNESTSYVPSFSNTKNVVFNEKTGNEDGYEDTLIADIKAEIASPSGWWDSNYTDVTKDHILTEKSATESSSWDFVRYIFAKRGVQVTFNNEEVGDTQVCIGLREKALKVGDILMYAPYTATLNKIQTELNGIGKNIKSAGPSYRTAVDLSSEGYEGIETLAGTRYEVSGYMFNNCIPLIYIGDGQFVAYSRDITQNFYSGVAKIYTFDMSVLDETRVYNVYRYKGFTVEPVFGYTAYFEGWTDENVACFIELLCDDCWETGEKVLTGFNDEDLETVDYSWYDEDLFSGNDVAWTTEHTDQFEKDLTTLLISYYDEYGILPSTGYTIAYALSNNRSTGESLTYYNIYEILQPNKARVTHEDKYSYDSDGTAMVETKDYKTYESYKEAVEDWIKQIKDTGIDLSGWTYLNYSDQLANFVNCGAIDSDTSAAATSRYNSAGVATQLKKDDKMALKRREMIEEMDALSNELASGNWVCSGTLVSDRSRYYELSEKLNTYYNDYITLKSIDTLANTSTDKSNEVLATFEATYNNYVSKQTAMYDYRINHQDSYIESYTCGGYPVVERTSSYAADGVPILIEKTTTAYHPGPNKGGDCCHPNYEQWERKFVMTFNQNVSLYSEHSIESHLELKNH